MDFGFFDHFPSLFTLLSERAILYLVISVSLTIPFSAHPTQRCNDPPRRLDASLTFFTLQLFQLLFSSGRELYGAVCTT